MTCGSKSFSTVFQSCQDDGQMIRKAVYNGNLVTVEKILFRVGLKSGTARSVGQSLTH